MNRERLIGFGLTDEQCEKVLAEHKASIEGAFIPRARFNEVKEELQRTKATIQERDEQLEGLKGSKGMLDTLKQQIMELQKANRDKEAEHSSEMLKLRRDSFDAELMRDMKAKNVSVLKAYLGTLEPIPEGVSDEEFSVLRKKQLEDLKKAESTKYLFHGDTEQKFRGVTPGEGSTAQVGGQNPFERATWNPAEQQRLRKEDIGKYEALARQAGML